MRIEPEEPTIVLPVEVFSETESRIVDMALDTGSTYVMIPWQVAESLGYDPAVSKKKVNLTTASTVEVVPLIKVRAIKTLGLKVNDVEVVCHDLPPDSKVEGLLGLSFLKHFDIELLLKQKELRLRDP